LFLYFFLSASLPLSRPPFLILYCFFCMSFTSLFAR
jgi:hypothetical protein